LEDVLALIQVLAMDARAHRSASGLADDGPGKQGSNSGPGKPGSAADWEKIAEEHLEFFRVSADAEHGISLVSRHVSGKIGEAREALPPEYTRTLLSTAIDLHDRQLKRSQRWLDSITVIASAVVAVAGVALAIITVVTKG